MNKKCFETRIAEAKNGVVVKIGCTVFVGKAEDLSELVTYYSHKVPESFKQQFPDSTAFITDCPETEGGADSESRFSCSGGIPKWIAGSSITTLKLQKVANGIILSKGNNMWVIKDDEIGLGNLIQEVIKYDCSSEHISSEPATSTTCCFSHTEDQEESPYTAKGDCKMEDAAEVSPVCCPSELSEARIPGNSY